MQALKAMFPSNQSLADAKLATPKELSIIESEGDLGRVWWIPISWAMTLVRKYVNNIFIFDIILSSQV